MLAAMMFRTEVVQHARELVELHLQLVHVRHVLVPESVLVQAAGKGPECVFLVELEQKHPPKEVHACNNNNNIINTT